MANSGDVNLTLKDTDQQAATGSNPGSGDEATRPKSRQDIVEELEKDHSNNFYCVTIFKLVGAIGNVLVVVAFGLMFKPNLFHYSDYVAASGSAVSLLSNIGILLADRKLRYDNRQHVKDLLKLITYRKENSHVVLHPQSLKTLIEISARPEDSRIINAMKCIKQGDPNDTSSSEDDPDAPLCECSCCPCSDSYPRSFPSFMLSPGFFEDTFQVVSPGWLLSSNIKAIADRVQNSDPPDNLFSMGFLGMICEFVELTLAVLSFFIVIATLCYQIYNFLKIEKTNIVNKVEKLDLGQASEDPPQGFNSNQQK